MSDPWVKMKKRITEWEMYSDPVARGIFMHLILTCNYKPSTYKGYKIGIGQAVTGRKQLSLDLGFTEHQIKRGLKSLKDTNEITIQATNKFSIITVVNWEFEQGKSKTKVQRDNQREDHPMPTSKEYNNLINILLTTGASEEASEAFIIYRKNHSKKPVNSEYAIKLIANRIQKLKRKGHDPTELLNTAHEKNWLTVYEPNEYNGKGKNYGQRKTDIIAGEHQKIMDKYGHRGAE